MLQNSMKLDWHKHLIYIAVFLYLSNYYECRMTTVIMSSMEVIDMTDLYDKMQRPLSIPMASKTFTQMIQNLGNFTKNSHVNPFYPTHNMQKMYLAGHTGHIGLTDNYKLDGSSLLKPSICRLPCYTL